MIEQIAKNKFQKTFNIKFMQLFHYFVKWRFLNKVFIILIMRKSNIMLIVNNIQDPSNDLNNFLILSKVCKRATIPGTKPFDVNECS